MSKTLQQIEEELQNKFASKSYVVNRKIIVDTKLRKLNWLLDLSIIFLLVCIGILYFGDEVARGFSSDTLRMYPQHVGAAFILFGSLFSIRLLTTRKPSLFGEYLIAFSPFMVLCLSMMYNSFIRSPYAPPEMTVLTYATLWAILLISAYLIKDT